MSEIAFGAMQFALYELHREDWDRPEAEDDLIDQVVITLGKPFLPFAPLGWEDQLAEHRVLSDHPLDIPLEGEFRIMIESDWGKTLEIVPTTRTALPENAVTVAESRHEGQTGFYTDIEFVPADGGYRTFPLEYPDGRKVTLLAPAATRDHAQALIDGVFEPGTHVVLESALGLGE